jgi:hypothetical protein
MRGSAARSARQFGGKERDPEHVTHSEHIYDYGTHHIYTNFMMHQKGYTYTMMHENICKSSQRFRGQWFSLLSAVENQNRRLMMRIKFLPWRLTKNTLLYYYKINAILTDHRDPMITR